MPELGRKLPHLFSLSRRYSDGHYEEAHKYNNVPPCDYDQNSEKCLNQSIIEQHTKNNSNGDHPNEKDTNSITNTRLVGTPQYSASSIIKR